MESPSTEKRQDYLSWRVWLAYLTLFAIGVPWYWAKDDARLLFGFPLWALVSFLSCVVIACLTAWLFLFRWPEDDDADENVGEKGTAER